MLSKMSLNQPPQGGRRPPLSLNSAGSNNGANNSTGGKSNANQNLTANASTSANANAHSNNAATNVKLNQKSSDKQHQQQQQQEQQLVEKSTKSVEAKIQNGSSNGNFTGATNGKEKIAENGSNNVGNASPKIDGKDKSETVQKPFNILLNRNDIDRKTKKEQKHKKDGAEKDNREQKASVLESQKVDSTPGTPERKSLRQAAHKSPAVSAHVTKVASSAVATPSATVTTTAAVMHDDRSSTPTGALQKEPSNVPEESDDVIFISNTLKNTPPKPPRSSIVTATASSVVSVVGNEAVNLEEHLKSTVSTTSVTDAKPAATSTPGKFSFFKAKAELPIPERNEYARSYGQISGRRSIRPLQDNTQFRETYRRINTELDVSSVSNSSMNVTVGSEVPNSSSFSFSFFGRGGRKRDRQSPTRRNVQSSNELNTDIELSPPKRARLDKTGFFSGLLYSPMTVLRTAFTRATIRNTPAKLCLEKSINAEDDDVQNVSGIVIEEEEASIADNNDELAQQEQSAEDVTIGIETSETEQSENQNKSKSGDESTASIKGDDVTDDQAHVEATESSVVSETKQNNSRCNIM